MAPRTTVNEQDYVLAKAGFDAYSAALKTRTFQDYENLDPEIQHAWVACVRAITERAKTPLAGYPPARPFNQKTAGQAMGQPEPPNPYSGNPTGGSPAHSAKK